MPYRSNVTLIFLLGFALDLLNLFMLNAAYPAMGRELQATVTQLAWIGNAYMLGLILVIPLGNLLAQRLGERTTLLLSFGLFAAGSLLAAMAGSIHALIGWRLLQGLGGGLLIPVGQAMAYRSCPAAERPRLTSLVMMVALLVPALSPALGGLAVDHASWRWMLLGLLPLSVIGAVLAWCWLPAGPAPLQRQPALDVHLLREPLLHTAMLIYLCVPGVFMGVNLVAALYLQTQAGLSASATGALMLPWALGALLAILFSRWQFNRSGPRPLLLAGMLLQASALPALAAVPGPWLVAVYFALGLGSSLCSSTAQNTAFTGVSAARMGAASGLWNLNRQLSFLLGVALLSHLLNLLLPAAMAYQQVFWLAAGLTLLPLPWVLRLPRAAALRLHSPH